MLKLLRWANVEICIQISLFNMFSLSYRFSNKYYKKHSPLSFNYLLYQILTTPTKAYNMQSCLVPLSSPDHLNGTDSNGDEIWSEQPPSDMAEMALTEELRQVQVQKYELSLNYAYKNTSSNCLLFLIRSNPFVSRHS